MKYSLKGRKSAEFISFFFSSSLILGLFIYLGIDFFKGEKSPYLEIISEVQFQSIRKVGPSYIIPVLIINEGDQTPSHANFELKFKSSHGTETLKFEVEYLAKKGTRTIYVNSPYDPQSTHVSVRLESYEL